MDVRRKELGEYVRAAREAQGFPSMQAFADAIGVSRRSVAKVENGEDDAGPRVMRAVARGLGWPSNSLTRYLRTGDVTLLAPSEKSEPARPRYPADLRDDVERKLWDIKDLDERSRWRHIYAHRTEAELAHRIAQHESPLQPPGDSTQTEQFG